MSDDIQDRAALALTKADFDAQALAMLPTGFAWARERGAVQPRLMEALVGNHYRAYQRIRALLDEADPRTAYETIRMWEIDCGLPDPCLDIPPESIEGRRAAVISRRQEGGTTRPLDFIALADVLGYEIEIEEFRPFRCWSACDSYLNTEEAGWPHTWRVNVINADRTVRQFNTGSGCDEWLTEWVTGELECIFERIKPAHTHIIWSYSIGWTIRSIWDAGASVWDDGNSLWEDRL